MHLLLRRSARDDGWIASSMTYLLDARLELEPEELHVAEKFALLPQPVYASDACLARLEAAVAHAEDAARPSERWFWQGEWHEHLVDAASRCWSVLLSLGNDALAALELSLTYEDLVAGRHIECEDLEAILLAEQAITASCQLLAAQLGTVLTFDGSEVLLEA